MLRPDDYELLMQIAEKFRGAAADSPGHCTIGMTFKEAESIAQQIKKVARDNCPLDMIRGEIEELRAELRSKLRDL